MREFIGKFVITKFLFAPFCNGHRRKIIQLNIVFTLAILMIVFSCSTNQKKNNNEIDELIIKDTTQNTNTPKTSANENPSAYFIEPLKDSTYTGDAEERYPNGIVKYKGFYRFGKRHGEWLYFYPNGNLWSQSIYNRGKLNGESNVYYPNGKLHYMAYYKNDSKDSVWTYYDSTGAVKMVEYYKEGKLVRRERK